MNNLESSSMVLLQYFDIRLGV